MGKFEPLCHYSCWMILTDVTLNNICGQLNKWVGWSWFCQLNLVHLIVVIKELNKIWQLGSYEDKINFLQNKPSSLPLLYYAYTCRSALLLLLCNLPIHSKYWPIWLQRLMLQDIQTKSKVPLGSRVCTQHRQWAMMGLIVIFCYFPLFDWIKLAKCYADCFILYILDHTL